MAEKCEVNEVSVKLTLDASEVISGLKAIQREARKATAAVAELSEKTARRATEDIRKGTEIV